MPNTARLVQGMRILITTGCVKRHVRKGMIATITDVREMGAEYSHAVRVVFQLADATKRVFFARHVNRLSDPVVSLNDGNPLHNIRVMRLASK